MNSSQIICPNCQNSLNLPTHLEVMAEVHQSGGSYVAFGNPDSKLSCPQCGHGIRVGDIIEGKHTPKSKGCFIATACCGSQSDPLVRDLRRFRDEVMVACAPGRMFTEVYARLSPPVANWIAERAWARALVRQTVVRPLAWIIRTAKWTR